MSVVGYEPDKVLRFDTIVCLTCQKNVDSSSLHESIGVRQIWCEYLVLSVQIEFLMLERLLTLGHLFNRRKTDFCLQLFFRLILLF